MRKILCNILVLLLLLLAISCGGGVRDEATRHRVAHLCNAIDESRYSDIARMDSAATELLALDASNELNMVAQNALAYSAMMQMDYRRATELYTSVTAYSKCEIERFAAEVGLMTICYRTSANREFFDYRAAALASKHRILEEIATLSGGDKERFERARVEFWVVSICYFSNIGLLEEREAAAHNLVQATEECDDISLRLYARMILAGGERDTLKRVEAYLRGLNIATNRGLVWLSANYKLLLAIALRNEAPQQQIVADAVPQLLALAGALSEDYLALSLAVDAVSGFSIYDDGYMKIEALAVAASCNTQMGRYYEALSLLDEALADINGYYHRYYPTNDSLEWNIVTYADDTDEVLLASDSVVVNIPECLLSVRREASCAYAGIGNKELSDINREAYLDLLRTTRMNKQVESRVQAATEDAARLYWWSLAAVLALLSVALLLYVINRRWRRDNDIYSHNLRLLLKISRNLLSSLPRELNDEEDVCNAVCAILADGFGGFAGDARFSLLAPFEACDSHPYVYRMPLPPVDDARTYTLYIATDKELLAPKLSIIELSLPYIAVAIEEGLRIANISDEQLRIEEQRLSHALYLAEHKRENLLKRVSASVLVGMRPYMDRMLNELRNLSRGENAETTERRLTYIAELTEKLDDYNLILERWIKMRRGELSLQIERFSVRELFDIIAKSRQFFDARGIELDVRMSDAVVKADRALTLFMINTLVDNAGKFTPAGGRIVVEAEECNDYVELSVTDSGIGLSSADINHILNEKVYDASLIGDAGDKLNGNKGGGFGLMNCKGIIEKYRKTDDIFSVCSLGISSSKGQGSRFSFRLPRGLARSIAILVAMMFSSAAICSDTLFNRVALSADSAFYSNVGGDYEKTFFHASRAIGYLNAYYRDNVGGSDTLSLFGGSAAELEWWRSNLFSIALKEDIFFNILDVRNEVAIASLATLRWQEYRYNNNIYASLYRLVHEDKGLEQHYENVQRLANHRQAAIALLLFMLLLLLVTYIISYVRKGVIERVNSRMVLELNERLLAVTGGSEPLPTTELAQRIADEILLSAGDVMCVARVSLLLKYGGDEAVVATAPSASPAAIYMHCVFESGEPYVSPNELLHTLPLYVLSAGERVMIGALELETERPLSVNELLNMELVARYAASIAYHSVVRLASHYKALAATEEETERVKYEENRLHVQNMVMDNCLSVIKHETIYYPGRIRLLVQQAMGIIDRSHELAEKVAIMRELMDYYNSVFAILSGCAIKQLDEISFRLSSVSLNEIFESMQQLVARRARKNGLQLLLQYESTHIAAMGDKDMLFFLFEELMNAAFEYKKDGELQLRAVDCGDVVRVELCDARHSLSDDFLSEMFTPSKNNILSAGGLAGMEYLVVKEIVRLHEDYMQMRGGRVEARACDGGYTIMFTLPKNSGI